jgi:DnaK suppressor protein
MAKKDKKAKKKAAEPSKKTKQVTPAKKAAVPASKVVRAAPSVVKAAPAKKPLVTSKKVTAPKPTPRPPAKSVKSLPVTKQPAPVKPAKSPAVAKKTKPTPESKPAKVTSSTKPAKPHNAVLRERPAPREPVKITGFIAKQHQRLLELRDHILDQMHGVAQDTLRVKEEGAASAFGMHQADAGSDAYDKDFALSLLSQEQDALYEIGEAISRIEGGTYGNCEMSGKPIPKPRLEAIPHARLTVECQAKVERENRGRRRWDTVPQFMDSAESIVDEDDEGSEEDDRRREKE